MTAKKSDLRVNEQIAVPQVRLIAEDGEQIGIVDTGEALAQARKGGLDLVEVSPQAEPPVCRIMNYGRHKYEHKHKRDQKKHHVSKLKELRLHPKTERHDIDVRLRQARRFLERGDRVLVNMIFRGREMAHVDLGRRLLESFAGELEDISKIEKFPSMDNRRMGMILVHHKGSESKKATSGTEPTQDQAPTAPDEKPSEQAPQAEGQTDG